MKRRLLFAFLLVFPAVLFAAPTQRYIVQTRHPYAEALQALPTEDFSPGPRAAMRLHHFQFINGFAADLTADQVQRLDDSSEVTYIEPVVERHAMDDSVTPGHQTVPWGVTAVNAPQVWPVTRGQAIDQSGPIHVAVIDTGIDYNSPEFKGVYKFGTNLIAQTNDPLDDNGHGTHVSGIIAAADMGKNVEGVVGVAPGVDLYAIKMLDACGSGTSEDVIKAIEWIIQEKQAIGGDWVANLSLGSDTASPTEEAEFQKGADDGILFFAAAGNSYDATNPTAIAYPGGYSSVEAVGAIDNTDQIASFSQRGPNVVVAPGVAVLSTFISAEVATSDGQHYAGTMPEIVKTDTPPYTPLDGYCLTQPKVSAQFVPCGLGNPSDFPSSVKGKIALIQRGTLTFLAKEQNAQAAGAIGVIVYDNLDESLQTSVFGPYTNPSTVPAFLPYLFISQADGQALQNTPNATLTMDFGFETWALLDGTSMATPHATAAAALAWAVAPTATNTAVATAVENTATNLGDANTYGHGLINALAAAESLNPAAFGIGATVPPTGRAMGRRGH